MANTGKTQKKKSAKPAKPAPLKKPTEPELVAEALDYRKQGYSPIVIAEVMKITPKRAEELIEKGLSNTYIEPGKIAALLEIERLNALLQAVYPNALTGEPEAIRALIATEERLAKAKMLLVPDIRELFQDVALMTLGNIAPTGRRKNGRPPHVKTVASCAKVDALASGGLTRDMIAKIMSISPDTLDKYYQDVMDTARDRTIAEMNGLVVQSARRGNSSDARWILSVRGGPEWRPPVIATPAKGSADDPVFVAGARDKERVTRIEVVGGLPSGSTPDNPGGDNFTEVPPEEAT